VKEVPQEGRDTTAQGRDTGPARMELVAGFRVLPFCARRQNRFDYARRPVNVCLEGVSGGSNRSPTKRLRKPGGSSSRPVRGGGWGAIARDRELEGGSEGKGRSPGPATGTRVRRRSL